MNEQTEKRIDELAYKSLEGIITEQECRELEMILAADPDAPAYYIPSIEFNHHILKIKDSINKPLQMMMTFEEMAEYEKTAPTVEIQEEKPHQKLIHKVVYPPRQKRKLSKFNIVFLSLNAAAVLFLVLFLKFAPSKHIEVARISDIMNAKWSKMDSFIQKGDRLVSHSDALTLSEGLVELTFDNHTRAVIEAPAEFQILAEDRIGLNYGKIYITVPKQAIGFSVYTQNAKIVDMGTEFGVQADSHGDTKLYVLKGKTLLMAGENDDKVGIEVSKGVAKAVSGDTSTVTDIPCDETHFVRDFDSESQVIWRRQPSLDLADMVRNGNGLGTGNSDVRLDPIKGFTADRHYTFSVVKGYRSIPEHPFVDGIFVPDGDTKQIVSSRGDVFEECPDTSGVWSVDLFANPKPEVLKTDLRGTGTIRFDGQDYTDQSGRSCIVMHANHGLTFDLEAIRKSYHRGIDRFTSRIGIADLKEDCPCNADFFVLVDGQVRYSLRQYKQKGVLNEVSLEIKDTDRFLTLVTTDGGDPDNPQGGFYERAISCDWCVFTEPVLVLE